MEIRAPEDMETAARIISERYGCAVLCKGGHDLNDANDLLWQNGNGRWFRGRRIANPNTHGTGCTLSSGHCLQSGKGLSAGDGCGTGKGIPFGALEAMLDLGKGRGPMDHLFDFEK